jgi:NADPH:quinone reductase-like Zn-dependent oxidoreductase
MKAIFLEKNGPPENLKLTEVEKPVPKDNEILVKVKGATVTIGDVHLRRAGLGLRILMTLMGFGTKKIPGTELAGEVEAVGSKITKFKPGDQIYGTTSGFKYGANAEYVCIKEEWKVGAVAMKPASLTSEEAAVVPVGSMTALQLLRRAGVEKEHKVLVYGASGSVGSYAVQIAKYWGAEVVGVCSTANVEMVKSLGADRVIDYTKEDFAVDGQVYDVIFDAVGKADKADVKKALKPSGAHSSIKSMTSEKNEYLDEIREIIEAGGLRPAIDRVYPLSEVPEAHRYVQEGHKKGNVVVKIG